jgi:nucleoid-associated protein YgaU
MNMKEPYTLRRLTWIAMITLLGLAFAGCPQAPVGPPTAEVTERIKALDDCIQRSDGVVQAALAAGASADDMAASSSAVANARTALNDARQLLQEGNNQAAMDRLTAALEACQKIEAMAAKARDESLARAAEAKQRADAESGLARIGSCIDNATRAIESAEVAGATSDELIPAQTALLSAQSAKQVAELNLSKGKYKKALKLIETAETNCRAANDAAVKAGIVAANRAAAKPTRYTVKRGDSLWGISASAPIYDNPFMWPLIYKANRDQIRDPDLIHPNQVFSVPRNYSQEEATSSIQRAKRRGPWRIGDGPDYYILEGVRR